MMDGNEPMYDSGGNNVTEQVESIVKANPSIKLMLDLLRRTVEEILHFTELIPGDFVSNKASYYRYGSIIVQPNFHLGSHTQQIKEALAKAAS
jgi:hypothetical protein